MAEAGVGVTTDARRSVRAGPHIYRTDVQGLRAVAVAVVVVFHLGLLPGGFLGVDVFFVISGFVVGGKLLEEVVDGRRLDLGTFYSRRILRILPAAGVLIATVALVSPYLAVATALHRIVDTAAAAGLFNANNFLAIESAGVDYFAPGAESNALLHMWSLGVEEQFYLVTPLIFLIAGRSRNHRRLVVAMAISAVGVLSFVLSLRLSVGAPVAAFYLAPTRAWEFCAGVLLVLAGIRPPRSSFGANVLALFGLLGIGVGSVWFDSGTPWPGTAAILPVASAVAIVHACSRRDIATSKVLASRPFAAIGDRSYSLYLWHWPFIVFARAAYPESLVAALLAAAMSIVPAELSYRFIESPLRVRRSEYRRLARRVLLVAVLVPLFSSVLAREQFSRLDPESRFEPFALHTDVVRNCDSAVSASRQCVWHPEAQVARGRAVLVGDSNAGMFSEVFIESSTSAGLVAEIRTHSNCPLAATVLRSETGRVDGCADFTHALLDDLAAEPPDYVVLAASADNYINQPRWTMTSAEGEVVGSSTEKAVVWERALAATIEPLVGDGTEVVVIHPIPKFRDRWAPYEESSLLGLPRAMDRAPTAEVGEAQRWRHTALGAETSAVMTTGVVGVDLVEDLCPGGRCGARADDGRWLYRDSGHLSRGAKTHLRPTFDTFWRDHDA